MSSIKFLTLAALLLISTAAAIDEARVGNVAREADPAPVAADGNTVRSGGGHSASIDTSSDERHGSGNRILSDINVPVIITGDAVSGLVRDTNLPEEADTAPTSVGNSKTQESEGPENGKEVPVRAAIPATTNSQAASGLGGNTS